MHLSIIASRASESFSARCARFTSEPFTAGSTRGTVARAIVAERMNRAASS